MTDHVFLRIMQLRMFGFYLPFQIAFITASRLITATMLFLKFILYSSSFVGTLKNEIPGAALELCQLKIKQFSPDILKFSTKHEDNPFTLNCFMFPSTFLFMFHAGSHRLGSNNFLNSSYKEKTAVSRLSLLFLWLWFNSAPCSLICYISENIDYMEDR